MARPKEFSRDEALDRAVQVFWNKGFAATTMTELRKAMGIGRQSLYDTFGDKNELFAEVLDRYRGMGHSRLEALQAGGLEQVREFLLGNVTAMSQPGGRQGCLMMNTCVELAPHNDLVAETVRQGLGEVRAAFEQALGRARELGEIPHDVDLHRAAAFLTQLLAGMAVMSKAGATPSELEGAVTMALAALA